MFLSLYFFCPAATAGQQTPQWRPPYETSFPAASAPRHCCIPTTAMMMVPQPNHRRHALKRNPACDAACPFAEARRDTFCCKKRRKSPARDPLRRRRRRRFPTVLAPLPPGSSGWNPRCCAAGVPNYSSSNHQHFYHCGSIRPSCTGCNTRVRRMSFPRFWPTVDPKRPPRCTSAIGSGTRSLRPKTPGGSCAKNCTRYVCSLVNILIGYCGWVLLDSFFYCRPVLSLRVSHQR